jgi:thiol-disulfide isomerase/thioredoxin
MRKIVLTLLVLLLSLSIQTFSQNETSRDAYKKGTPSESYKRPAKVSQKDLTAEVKKFVEERWASHIAKCGDSSYFVRTEEVGKDVLFEVREVEYETSGGPVAPTVPDVSWSGSSVARFASYRTMSKDAKTWSEWKPGGAESFLFQNEKPYGWTTVPRYFPSTSCMGVKVFTGELGEGRMLPDSVLSAEMKSIDGEVMTLGKQKGLVLLYLWATWCGPCRMEGPELIKLQDKYGEKGFTVIALDIDPETDKMIRAYQERMGINYPAVTSGRGLISDLLSLSRINAIPQAFLIADGKLLAVYKGYNPRNTMQDMEAAIEAALAK